MPKGKQDYSCEPKDQNQQEKREKKKVTWRKNRSCREKTSKKKFKKIIISIFKGKDVSSMKQGKDAT